jgi:hypothetical protein
MISHTLAPVAAVTTMDIIMDSAISRTCVESGRGNVFGKYRQAPVQFVPKRIRHPTGAALFKPDAAGEDDHQQ